MKDGNAGRSFTAKWEGAQKKKALFSAGESTVWLEIGSFELQIVSEEDLFLAYDEKRLG